MVPGKNEWVLGLKENITFICSILAKVLLPCSIPIESRS